MYEQPPPQNKSRGLSLRTVFPIALFLFFLGLWTCGVLAVNPIPASVSQAIPDEWKFWLAKGLHVAAYAFLTLLANLLPVPRWMFWLVVAGLVMHGAATEVGQTFTANRQGSLRDVVLDWVGVGLGLGLLLLSMWWSWRNRPEARRHDS